MLKLAIVLRFVAVATSLNIIGKGLDHTWELWKGTYSKKYTKDEEILRRHIWEDNFELVTRHNMEHSIGLQSFTLEMNEFADLVCGNVFFSSISTLNTQSASL